MDTLWITRYISNWWCVKTRGVVSRFTDSSNLEKVLLLVLSLKWVSIPCNWKKFFPFYGYFGWIKLVSLLIVHLDSCCLSLKKTTIFMDSSKGTTLVKKVSRFMDSMSSNLLFYGQYFPFYGYFPPVLWIKYPVLRIVFPVLWIVRGSIIWQSINYRASNNKQRTNRRTTTDLLVVLLFVFIEKDLFCIHVLKKQRC